MSLPRVIFAHERPSVRRAVERVLAQSGFETVVVQGGRQARAALLGGGVAALVVDVGLPEIPGYELAALATELTPRPVVILVASVYRRTSYKRRPTRLYGADDYVEIHHLCDQLPGKLRQHLGLEGPGGATLTDALELGAEELREEGDRRIDTPSSGSRLASLIVADMVLYNGDRLAESVSLTAAETAVADDLAIARDMFTQVMRAEGHAPTAGDPVGDAFRSLMSAMGRNGEIA